MKKTSYIFSIALSAIALGVFFIPVGTVNASALYPAPFTDNFDSYPTNWTEAPSNTGSGGRVGPYVFSGSECFSGDCIGADNTGTLFVGVAGRTATGYTQGGFTFRAKTNGGGFYDISPCLDNGGVGSFGCGSSGTSGTPLEGNGFNSSVGDTFITDGVYHIYTILWRSDNANIETCTLTDSFDPLDCGTWKDTGTAVGDPIFGFFIRTDSWNTAGRYLYIDDIIAVPSLPISLTGTTTRIISQNTPLPGSVEPDTTVTFEYNFYNNDIQTPHYTVLGVEIINQTQGITYNTAGMEVDIVSSGGITYTNEAILLDTGDAFAWRAYARTASSTAFLRGEWYSFSVVEQNANASPFTPIPSGISTTTASSFCDENVPFDDSDIIQATITFIPNGICKVASFLVIPSEASVNSFQNWGNVITTKIPFSYAIEAYGIYNELNTAISSSSTTNFPVLELEYGSTTGSTFHGSVVLFSSTTVNALFPPSVRNGFRNLLTVVLWLGFASYMLLLVRKLTMPKDLS